MLKFICLIHCEGMILVERLSGLNVRSFMDFGGQVRVFESSKRVSNVVQALPSLLTIV